MYLFKKTKSPQNPYDLGDVEITTHDDEIALHKLFQQFVSFAQACGFVIPHGTAFVVDGNGCYVDNDWGTTYNPDEETDENNSAYISAEEFYRQTGFDPPKPVEEEKGSFGKLPPPSDFDRHTPFWDQVDSILPPPSMHYWAHMEEFDSVPVKSVTTSGCSAGIIDPSPYKNANWTSTDDKLPSKKDSDGDVSEMVLGYVPSAKGSKVWSVWYNHERNIWEEENYGELNVNDVTHWMALDKFLFIVGAPK